ncbi:sulfur carrier protein ThiS [uncultured Gilvimarinus sp.]|uniref:sulfur carrier protein ThiS n=1 Tax=uncultured Gilvimarinus sp. TaxID=1689143 RepID=UPI0030EC6FBF|tara:strand:+ start:363 stop:587 length:225 start_codon:yes stop_codon:yes gene_type:complete
MSSASIEIFLNGTRCELPPATSLSEAINQWQTQNSVGEKFAAAINGEFVPRSQHSSTLLASGDLVDIVQPVGGG